MTRARNIANPTQISIPLDVSANITSNAVISVGNTVVNTFISETTIVVGNTTVNTVIHSTGITANGANIHSVNAASVGGNTASTLRSYSDTVSGTAYSNAISVASTDATNKASNAYSNAASFASNASNISSGTLNVDRISNSSIASGKLASNAAVGNIGYIPMDKTTVYSTTVGLSGKSAGSWYTLIPTDALIQGAVYVIRVSWDHGGAGAPYLLTCAFLYMPVFSNGSGSGNSFTPICATHIGGGYTFSFRALCASGFPSTGLEFTSSFNSGGTIYVDAQKLF